MRRCVINIRMEPMTLGSPVGSPASSPFNPYPGSGLGNITTSSNTFYPAYLMGESQTTLSSRVPPGSISPGHRARQFSASTISTPNSPQVARDNLFLSSRIGGERQGGPPTLVLMGGLPQSPSTSIQSTSFVDQQRIIASPGLASSLVQTPGPFNSPISSTHINQPMTPYTPTRDIFHGTCSEIHLESQSSEPLEDTWVTVYGFPVASASYILTQFAQLGTIVDQRQPGLGNWMHLKYQTKLQARKALAKNSKIFSGNIMVGVVPCSDKSIIEEKENVPLDKSGVFSPRESITSPIPKSHIRPLTQAYHASKSEIEVTPGSNTPKKNEGLVSKAIQHILGV